MPLQESPLVAALLPQRVTERVAVVGAEVAVERWAEQEQQVAVRLAPLMAAPLLGLLAAASEAHRLH